MEKNNFFKDRYEQEKQKKEQFEKIISSQKTTKTPKESKVQKFMLLAQMVKEELTFVTTIAIANEDKECIDVPFVSASLKDLALKIVANHLQLADCDTSGVAKKDVSLLKTELNKMLKLRKSIGESKKDEKSLWKLIETEEVV